ncbi:MAG: peptidyl-prolyl cis-trans isomerase [Acetobacteraceae bacterium]|jgi:peptidyl-prolyl cis-trans isomerase C|nr:peptidyl-prolyl cis-trans isomerase [Acetobacteraceae bacterium]
MPFFPGCSLGPPARLLGAVVVFGIVCAGPVLAQADPDPVLAKVNDQPIHASDLKAAAESLPAQARTMPPQQLYPLLLDQLVDAQALVVEAKKTGLDKDPAVQRTLQMAQDRTLASAMLNKVVRPQVSDDAVKARFDAEFANKQGESEVHSRHILVSDEATAKKIIADLKKGGDFAALSKQYSKDPGASAQGGDLGFFKKTDMVPEFATAAFALKDNEVTPAPVKTEFGWHVIQTLEHRTSQPPTFEQERDELRQKMVQAAVQKEVAQARSEVTVQTFNMDGSPVKATDTAQPPPAPQSPATPSPAPPSPAK